MGKGRRTKKTKNKTKKRRFKELSLQLSQLSNVQSFRSCEVPKIEVPMKSPIC